MFTAARRYEYISAIAFNIMFTFLNKITYYGFRMFIAFIYSNIVDYRGCTWIG